MGRVNDTWAAVRRSTGSKQVLPIQLNDKGVPPSVMAAIGQGKPLHSSFFFIDGDGKLVAEVLISGGSKADPHDAAAVAYLASGYRTARAGLAEWEKAKTPAAKATALARVGAAPTDEGRKLLFTEAASTTNPVGLRKAAVKGLSRQIGGGAGLAPLLTDKNAEVRAAASRELKGLGVRGVGAVLKMLASEKPEERAAAGGLVVAMVRAPAVARTVTFWRSGKEEEREKAVERLRAWLVQEASAAAGIPRR